MAFRIGVIFLWLCFTAWLIRYEAFPEHFTHSISGYKGLIAREVLVADSWMKISFRGEDIGYSHTGIDINETNSLEHYIMENRVHIAINIMGKRNNIHAISSIMLDDGQKLARFTFALSSPAASVKVEGIRKQGSNYEVSVRTEPDALQTTTLSIPSDVILYSPLTETAMKNLKPGQDITMRIFDPISMRKTNLMIHALRHQTITMFGTPVEATVLSSQYQGIEMTTWIDSSGNVLRQESEIGWTMQKCTPEEAYDAALGNRSSSDVLKIILPLLFLTEKKND